MRETVSSLGGRVSANTDRIDGLLTRLDDGQERFNAVEKRLDMMCKSLSVLPDIQKDLQATREVVEAWTTVRNIGKFAKWLASVGVIAAAIWAALKGIVSHAFAAIILR